MASSPERDAAPSGINEPMGAPPLPRTPRAESGSISSVQDDQLALSQVLDRIHTSASQSDALTAFDEFSSPPPSFSISDGNDGAGDAVQNSMSALYSRLRGAVDAAKERVVGTKDHRGVEVSAVQRRSVGESGGALETWDRERHSSSGRDLMSRAASTERSRPPGLDFSASKQTVASDAGRKDEPTNGQESHAGQGGTPALARPTKPSHTLLAKPTVSSPIDPTVAPVNISARKDAVTDDRSNLGAAVEAAKGDASPMVSPSIPTDTARETGRAVTPRMLSNTSSFLGKALPTPTSTSTTAPSLAAERLLGHGRPGPLEPADPGSKRPGPQDSEHGKVVQKPEETVSHPPSGTGSHGGHSPTKTSSTDRHESSSLASAPPSSIAAVELSPTRSRHSRANSSTITSTRASSTAGKTSRPAGGERSPHEARLGSDPTRRGVANIALLPAFNVSRASSLDVIDARSDDLSSSLGYSFGRARTKSRSRSRRRGPSGSRTPKGNIDAATSSPSQMRSKVLSKDFWMRDENCKECYLCGDAFSTFRRKHHCRTCGQIFDAKCTTLISGLPYGHSGSLRVCNSCKDLIDAHEYTDDSDLEAGVRTSKRSRGRGWRSDGLASLRNSYDGDVNAGRDQMLATTPMMAIPATRTARAGSKRGSAILEIDPEASPSRPASSRSFKPPMTARPLSFSFSHRRHRSKAFHNRSFRAMPEERAPFHQATTEQRQTDATLPAFHHDSIIDPELAAYISDDASSADEQMSLSAAMNGDMALSGKAEIDKNNMSFLLGSAKKSRSRFDETSNHAMSPASRDHDEDARGAPRAGHPQMSSRPRSVYGTSPTQARLLPSVQRSAQLLKNFGSALPDVLSNLTGAAESTGSPRPNRSRMTKSASMKGASAPPVELNNASLQHVRQLLGQLLQDARVPNVDLWENALMPILLQCTDDVNPEIRHGDDIDIRHYVKIKRIPGGVPADTSYISGVVFTKNLALKSMSRSLSQPRVVIVTFPIEYRRHQQRFLSLGPVIAQEKEYLENLINRITALRPHFLLAQHSISGVALQYLADANVATASNVKPSVLEAVSRCTETDIISSVDMLVLKSVHVGNCGGLDVKTYVNKDVPRRKKTFVYISGCSPDLGCTIVLRGENMKTLAELKRITEFMVYVVYSLKLETCLMRDEFVLIPSIAHAGTLAHETHPDSYIVRRDCGQASLRTGSDPSGPVRPYTGSEAPDDDATAQEALSAGSAAGPDGMPLPLLYSDIVEKHRTRILSASPFVKFMLPYLLRCAREQESRLLRLRELLDEDIVQKQISEEKAEPRKFSLVRPEMVHQPIQGLPRKVMEVIHAIHDAEYDRALYTYETTKRQWETYIAGNIDLFDPYAHQNIVVLYSLVCTSTTTPCVGPDLLAMAYYNEHAAMADFTPDCTLGQFVEDLCFGANDVCSANGCHKPMLDHHRSYVHGEGRLSIFVEHYPCKMHGLQNSILMWSCCKTCGKETQVVPMSENTWRYSLGKYLELSFWSPNLRLKAGVCPHHLHRDHVRFFGYKDLALRVHYDNIELLEIVVPRARITWNVTNDLRLKNETYSRVEGRLNRFMTSVKARLKGISTNTVVSDRVDAFTAEIDRLLKRANEDHLRLVRKLQKRYMESKYYEIIPLNRAMRALQKVVVEWDIAFADLEADFFPSEKDITRLAVVQMKRIFLERDSSTPSLSVAESGGTSVQASDNGDNRTPAPRTDEPLPRPSQMTAEQAHDVLTSVVEEDSNQTQMISASSPALELNGGNLQQGQRGELEKTLSEETLRPDHQLSSVRHLDLAVPPSVPHDAASSEEGLGHVPNAAQRSDGDRKSEAEANPLDADQAVLATRPEGPGEQLKEAAVPPKPTKASAIPRPIDKSRKIQRERPPPLLRSRSHPAPFEKQAPGANRTSPEDRNRGKVDGRIQGPHRRPQDQRGHLKVNDAESQAKARPKTIERLNRSNIPRSVSSGRKETHVSTLAKHFEQLSREFEKERLREKRLRAASNRRTRERPMTSSKPIVQVYQDILEAVDEHEPIDNEPSLSDRARSNTEGTTSTSTTDANDSTAPTSVVDSPVDGSHGSIKPDGTADAPEQATVQSQTASDAEVEGVTLYESDGNDSLPDDLELPTEEGIAESLARMDIKGDIPKHERTSLMKMLTNFWAERSSSGWAPLDYPIGSVHHIFLDSDIIIREDEPSSLIAFALGSEDYKAKLHSIRGRGGNGGPREKMDESGQSPRPKNGIESSLLKATGTHLKYQFQEGSARMMCKVFYAEQFDAVRRQCGVADRIVESLSRCVKWDSKGGKTRSVFLKTLDERFVLKSLSPVETQAFLSFAPAYFQIMSEALFHELPTVIAKMLGFFQLVVRNPVTGVEIKWDVLVMENLFYDRTPTRIFDLKGSMRNRKIQSTGNKDEVLLDENMVEFIYESPLFVREHSKKLLRASVWNDTLFLARQNVMDYSLMIAVDEDGEDRKELVVGIVDCIRTYTWDKKLESWIKDRGFAGGGKNKPTVTSPKEYKSRFREAMARYVLQAPNCWHQFQAYHPSDSAMKSSTVTSTTAASTAASTTAQIPALPTRNGRDSATAAPAGDVEQRD